MTDITMPEAPAIEERSAAQHDEVLTEDDLVLDDEVLVEDVSIDGMCGVY
jgi:mycofactocin precursor